MYENTSKTVSSCRIKITSSVFNWSCIQQSAWHIMETAKFPSMDHVTRIIEAVLLDAVREMEHVEVWSSERMGTKNKQWSAHLS